MKHLHFLRGALISRLAPGGRGGFGEAIAVRHLKAKGYAIKARNYRVKGGEADIIASRGGLLVVVEVKTRTNRLFGSPEEAVTRTKTKRALKAGRVYCRRHGLSLALLRGDVVAVEFTAKGKNVEIRHHEGALV